MNMKLRDAALGAATMALLLYAAITASRSVTATAQDAPQACVSAACSDALQLARGKD